MHQQLVDGVLAERSDILGVALVGDDGLCLASGGPKAEAARCAGAAADPDVLKEGLMLIEARDGTVVLHRWSEDVLAVLLLEGTPHLGAVIAASRHRLDLLRR